MTLHVVRFRELNCLYRKCVGLEVFAGYPKMGEGKTHWRWATNARAVISGDPTGACAEMWGESQWQLASATVNAMTFQPTMPVCHLNDSFIVGDSFAIVGIYMIAAIHVHHIRSVHITTHTEENGHAITARHALSTSVRSIFVSILM
jgi:hypothetical protein